MKGIKKPIIENGYVDVPDAPGIGIEDLDDEVLKEHMHSKVKGLWEPTDEWDEDWSHDRLWS